MTNIPGRKKRRFYERKALVEGVSVVPPLVATAVGALSNIHDPAKSTLGWILAGATAWLLVASFLKVAHAHSQDREQKEIEAYPGLVGAVHVLHSAVAGAAGIDDPPTGILRATIHRVVPPPKDKRGGDADTLEQLLPYVGGPGGQAGRTFSIRSGIIGKAVREKAAFAFSRQNDDLEAFVSELVRDWGFPEGEARDIRPDRYAWMAVPISGRKGSIVGVVYLDSNDRSFFSDEVREIVISACAGVASYIQRAY